MRAGWRAQGARAGAGLDRHVRERPAAAETLLAPLEPALAERARALLARGATVIVPNPQGRYAHLCGDDPERIGVRVSAFAPPLAAALEDVGAILATSANLHGGPDPRTLAEVPAELPPSAPWSSTAGLPRPGTPVDGARPVRAPDLSSCAKGRSPRRTPSRSSPDATGRELT